MSTVRIQVRRGSAAQWASVNPILAAGEMGVESDTNLFKFGNGTSTWTALAYANNSDVAIAEISQDAINTALSMGAGLTKSYNDGTNTIQITVDSDVVALKSYVDSAISNVQASVTGLENTVDANYIPVSDRGAAGGVASLDNSGLIPNSQIDDNNWATKLHVASVSSGLQIKLSVRATSTANFASTRTAGSADAAGGNGVGERLTASSNGALVIDGVTLNSGDRVLLKNQTDAKQNGIYVVTNAGGSSAAAVLTRATDADNSVDGEVREGLFTFTQEGTANARDGYVLLASASRSGEIFQLGTDSLTFSQFTGAIPVTVSTGLSKNGDSIEVDTNTIATKSYVDGINSALTQITTQHGTAIDAVETKNNEQDTAIALNSDAIAAHTTSIASITTVNNTQNTRLSALEAADVTLGGLLSNANQAVVDLETELRADLAPKNNAEFTGTLTLPSTTAIGNVSGTEIAHLDGVTSGIQTQLDSKASNTALSNHEADTTNIHGIADTSALATKTYADSAVSTHEADTTNVHGIADTSALATKTYADSAITTHNSNTTTAHGVTGAVVGTTNTQTLTNKTLTSPIINTPTGITKSDVGLTNVDNTSDANKPVSTATQTALDLKAPKANPTFTGTLTAADVNITGNLNITGTTTTVDSQNLAVTDSLIYLAKNQYSADVLDIGIYGAYGTTGNNGGNHPHTGLVRDASDGKWKLISGGAEPTSSEVDFTTATKDTLVIGALDATSATIGNVSNTELQYLDGVTSAIQTQIDAKSPLASPTFTGTVTIPTGSSITAPTMYGTVTYSSGAKIQFSDGTQQSTAGVPSLTVIATELSADYNLSTGGLTLRDQLIPIAGTRAITVPPNSTTAFPIGTSIDFYQASGTGANFVEGSGVTILRTPGLKLRTTYSSATLTKVATNTWLLAGDLTA